MTTEPRTHRARVRLVSRESPGQTMHTTFATHKATHSHARQVKRCRSNHAHGYACPAHRLTTHTGGFIYTPRAWVVLLAADGPTAPQCPHFPPRRRHLSTELVVTPGHSPFPGSECQPDVNG